MQFIILKLNVNIMFMHIKFVSLFSLTKCILILLVVFHISLCIALF